MMENANHTPGPWETFSLRDGSRNVIAGQTRFICQFSHCDSNVCRGEQEANGRLIAAAPELLQGLEEMLALVEMSIPFDGPQQRKARAAIAKAKGGE